MPQNVKITKERIPDTEQLNIEPEKKIDKMIDSMTKIRTLNNRHLLKRVVT